MPFRAMLWITMVAVLLPSTPRAQVPDHLKCYKIKDSAKKAVYTADLGGLAPEPGCQVKLPGKLLCVETTKSNVSPTPPGAPAGPAAGQFVCYKVKCPKGAPPVVTVTDQFGTHTFTPSAAQLLCAPAQGTPPTTTTTLCDPNVNPCGSTTTTTTSTTSTTLSSQPVCCQGPLRGGIGGLPCVSPTTASECLTEFSGIPVEGAMCGRNGCGPAGFAAPGACCQTTAPPLTGCFVDESYPEVPACGNGKVRSLCDLSGTCQPVGNPLTCCQTSTVTNPANPSAVCTYTDSPAHCTAAGGQPGIPGTVCDGSGGCTENLE